MLRPIRPPKQRDHRDGPWPDSSIPIARRRRNPRARPRPAHIANDVPEVSGWKSNRVEEVPSKLQSIITGYEPNVDGDPFRRDGHWRERGLKYCGQQRLSLGFVDRHLAALTADGHGDADDRGGEHDEQPGKQRRVVQFRLGSAFDDCHGKRRRRNYQGISSSAQR